MNKLDRIEIEGYKSIRSASVELRALNVLIGANGVGKSNFISLFRLLNRMVAQQFQFAIAQGGEADTILFFGRKTTSRARVRLDFGPNSYECSWVPTVDGKLIFGHETGFFRGDFKDLDITPLGSGHKETNLIERANMGKMVPRHILKNLASWRVYHFHDTSESATVKQPGALNDNLFLRADAGNLAAFLLLLRETKPSSYELIRDTVRLVAPFFDDFLLRPMPLTPTLIQLEWRARGSDFPFLAHHLSDGTLRFICLATLLLQPDLPSCVLIDEPELGLHPYAITTLASIIRSASKETQLIVSTQSVSLVNEFEPEDLLVVDLRDGASEIQRVDGPMLESWLDEYTLGEIWEKNVIGGRPSR